MRMPRAEDPASVPRHAPAPSLDRAFDSADTRRSYVRRLFTTIAPRYDLITRVLSFGRDRRWKARLLDLSGIGPDQLVVDLACGTGDLALMAASRSARVVGLDVVPEMIRLAQDKPGAKGISWLVGDMVAVPIKSGAADAVLTGYGLRNVPDLGAAIVEIHRVLKPGGTLCALDFDRPDAPWLLRIYLGYLRIVGGALGWLLHGEPDTYRYIPASIGRYPGARAVAVRLSDAGFRVVAHRPVFGGLMAIHVARK